MIHHPTPSCLRSVGREPRSLPCSICANHLQTVKKRRTAVSPRASVASLPKLSQLTLTAWDAFFVPLQAVNPLSVLAGGQSATSRASLTFCAGLSLRQLAARQLKM